MKVGTRVKIKGNVIVPSDSGVYTGKSSGKFRIFMREQNAMIELYENEFEVIL